MKTLTLILWLAYAPASGSGTSAMLTLVPDMPNVSCFELALSDPRWVLGSLGPRGLAAIELVRAKKKLHPRMRWGFECVLQTEV